MKRRNFLKYALGLFSVPILAKTVEIDSNNSFYFPKTAEGLYKAINTLGVNQSKMSKSAYEEKDCERYTHVTYALGETNPDKNTEANIVNRIFEEMQMVSHRIDNPNPLIIWRRKPEYYTYINDDGDLVGAIGFRVSIGSDNEMSNFVPFIKKYEGSNHTLLNKTKNNITFSSPA